MLLGEEEEEGKAVGGVGGEEEIISSFEGLWVFESEISSFLKQICLANSLSLSLSSCSAEGCGCTCRSLRNTQIGPHCGHFHETDFLAKFRRSASE